MTTTTATQFATLSGVEQSNARNLANEKETVSTLTVVAFRDGEFHHPVTARFYMGRSKTASVVYCALWVHSPDYWTSGRGTAGGYGYHKESAALDDAITSAGITLSRSISGVGESAMKDALTAIANGLGFDKITIV